MKKRSKIIASVLAASLTLGGIVACSNSDQDTFEDPIDYTVGQKIVTLESNSSESQFKIKHSENAFWSFLKYSVNESVNDELYVLNAYDKIYPISKFNCGHYELNGEDRIREQIAFADLQIGSTAQNHYQKPALDLDFVFKPIDTIGELTYEFCTDDADKFINIYSGDECFATCTVKAYVPITEDWYRDYLSSHLIKICDLVPNPTPDPVEPKEITAQAPAILWDDPWTDPACCGYKRKGIGSKFFETKNMYLNKFKNSKLFLLNYDFGNLQVDNYRCLFYNHDGGDNNIELNISIYDPALGIAKKNDLWKSANFYCFIKPVDYDESYDMSFDYGIYYRTDEVSVINGKLRNKDLDSIEYVNIYLNGQAFCTCYIESFVDIPMQWYIDYFTSNLVYGDSLQQ